MKVLLYSETLPSIENSGLGQAIKHQMRALELNNVDYTLNPHDDFDLLHINTYFLKSQYLIRECKAKHIPIVYHAHSTQEDFENSFVFSNHMAPVFGRLLKLSYQFGDVLIAPTPYAKRCLSSYGLSQPIIPISNGIELERFKPRPGVRQRFREQFDYQENDFIVMGIGLYLERKGIIEFVELARRMPHIQFIWFGFLNLNLVPQNVRQAVETKLPNLCFTGQVENDIIIEALQATDLFIFPTLEETEGIPAIEACAAKADFIVRDIPVFEDWLFEGQNVYKAKTIDGFQRRIDQFYHHEIPSLAENAYQVAVERDLQSIGRQLKAVYDLAWTLREQKTDHN